MNPLLVAEQVGTPCYVYDLGTITDAHADLTKSLPHPSTLYYSLKANPHPRIVAALAELGCHAEISSKGEIDSAVEAGVPGEHMLLTGPGKAEETIDYALGHGIRHFSVDSPVDLDRVGERAFSYGVEVECLLRVNADSAMTGGSGLTMTGTASQFGADAAWILEEPQRFKAHGIATVTGLHLYMGSNLLDEDTLVSQFGIAIDLVVRLSEQLEHLREVDLGGGFGAPYAKTGSRPQFPNLAARVEEMLDDRLKGWRTGEPRISFESGRYLVAESGVLVCEVLDAKRSKDELFVVLDTGVNHLGGMSGLRRIPRSGPSVIPASGIPHEPEDAVQTSVVGPLCTPLDTLGHDMAMPPMATGDLVTVPNVGAYGLTASLLAFLGHRAPMEVVTRGNEVLVVSQLQVKRSDLDPDRFFDPLSTQGV
ncbi:type III PLP-dependent enzyme [Amycolatopsis sp. NBC_00345]|uniref:type III PLP-dependent enzyme n=1 Tax=Amycolatopsis sp. NBC_00345 TaxID=2975955 RepID=UPI002E255D69